MNERTRDSGGPDPTPAGSGVRLRERRPRRVVLTGGLVAVLGAGLVLGGTDGSADKQSDGQLLVVAAPAAAPAAPVDNRAAPADPVLRQGSSGQAVRKLQKLLRIKRTGSFDRRTLRAVVNYQRGHGIPATGVVATLTWGSLLRSTAPASVPAASAERPVLSLGMQNEWVRQLQQRLRMPLVTGYFGPMTLSYVQEVQRRVGIPVSGVVDRRTWNKSGKVRVSPGASPSTPAAPAAPASSKAARVLSLAASLQGIPYVANGYSPSVGFNCSSYTQYVYSRAGVDIGGAYTVWQYNKARKISRAQAKPGDLVFMYNYENDFIGHVGIYAGNDQYWHSPRPGRVVSLDKIYTDKVYFGRVL